MQVWNTLQGGQRRGREEWRNHLSLTCLGLHAQLIRINHVSGREGGKVEKDPEYSGAQPPCHLSLHLFEYHILCICVCTCVYVCVSVCVGVIFICSQFLCICAKSLHLGPTLCDPVNYSLQGSSVHGDSPGKNTEVGCHAFLQGIFLTLGLNPRLLRLLHCRLIFFICCAIGVWLFKCSNENLKMSGWASLNFYLHFLELQSLNHLSTQA